MIQLKACSLLLIIFLGSAFAKAQHTITGKVTAAATGTALADVRIYSKAGGLLASTDSAGLYSLTYSEEVLTIIFFSAEYEILELQVSK